MNDAYKPVGTSGDGPGISIEDLIRACTMQMMFAQATIHCLEKARVDKERLAQQDIELERLKRLQVAWEIEQFTKGK